MLKRNDYDKWFWDRATTDGLRQSARPFTSANMLIFLLVRLRPPSPSVHLWKITMAPVRIRPGIQFCVPVINQQCPMSESVHQVEVLPSVVRIRPWGPQVEVAGPFGPSHPWDRRISVKNPSFLVLRPQGHSQTIKWRLYIKTIEREGRIFWFINGKNVHFRSKILEIANKDF